MNPRYFVGISLPDDLKHSLEKIQSQLLQDHAVMQPLIPHITLLHPNILMTLSPLYFIPYVRELADNTLPIKLELTKTAMFDQRVLYITVKSAPLMKLHEHLVNLLPADVKSRYQIGREYKPHITIAQAKPLQSLNAELKDKLAMSVEKLLPYSFEATELTQFSSLGPRSYTPKRI